MIASYLDARKHPCIWYQLDEGDADIGTFFHYMGLAADKAAPRIKRPLPHFTPEYQFGLPTFTRRYFENLFGRMTSPSVLVFDNYQVIPPESPFHEMIVSGLSEMPPGINAVIISRGAAPASFARPEASGALQVIDWDSLRLEQNEVAAVMNLNSRAAASRESVRYVYGKTEGWAAGVALMMRAGPEGQDLSVPVADRREAIFNYFASEIYNKADARTRDVLIKTSLFPKITLPIAERLTGMRHAGRILADLHRDNYFTERRAHPEVTYQFHALFREYLLTRAAETLTPEQMSALQKQAGKLLEENGQIEAAAELYIGASDWHNLLSLITNSAPSFVAQGRTQLLAQWLTAIPERIAAVNGWVLYWKGVCKIAFDPKEARPMFEQAFDLFTKEPSLPGSLLAWSGVVDTYLYAWNDLSPLDNWIDVFEGMWKPGSRFPSREIEIRTTTSIFAAVFLRSPWRDSLPYWEAYANKLLREGIDIGVYPMLGNFLMLFYTFTGDLEKASAVYRFISRAVRSEADNPTAVLVGKAIEAYYCWFNEAQERSLQAVSEGLAAANTTGLHLWDMMLSAIGVYNMLGSGDYIGADRYLRGMESMLDPRRLLDVTHYHYNLSWSAVLSGDLVRAREQGELFMAITDTSAQFLMNLNRVAMAHVLILSNEQSRAATLLREVQRFLKSVDSALLEFKYHLVRAHAAVTAGEERACADEVRKAFAVGRSRKIYRFDWWLPSVMQSLCAFALERDIETPYVRELIRRRRLPPDGNSPAPSSWPWPIKIFTLGQFSLELEGKAVMFGGKAPKKPLELLKAIIAMGGKDVSEERIIDVLWPEASGDLAYKSFEMALQRLRKLINSDNAVHRQDGLLTLDARYCWTDVSAFEKLVRDTEPLSSPSKEMQRLERALQMYKGHFLPSDAKQPWLTFPRERLRSKFLRLVTKAGDHYEQAGEWKKAIDCFERGLERDTVCEEFYQHVMLCHHRLGHRAEAVKTYERCRAALLQGLGLEPSPRTEEIHSAIRGMR